MKPPILGSTLWLLNIGNAARHTPQKFTPVTVLTVGRKYFTVGEPGGPKHLHVTFHLEHWREKSEYSANHACYPNPESWENEKEAAEINDLLRKTFQYSGSKLTLDQLRRMKTITEEV